MATAEVLVGHQPSDASDSLQEDLQKVELEWTQPLLEHLRRESFDEKQANQTFVNVYSVVVNYGDKHESAVKMYEYYTGVLIKFCKEQLVVLRAACGAPQEERLLLRFASTWERYTILVFKMQRAFQYLDRFFTKGDSYKDLFSRALDIFRANVYDLLKRANAGAMVAAINLERDGRRIREDALLTLTLMLCALSATTSCGRKKGACPTIVRSDGALAWKCSDGTALGFAALNASLASGAGGKSASGSRACRKCGSDATTAAEKLQQHPMMKLAAASGAQLPQSPPQSQAAEASTSAVVAPSEAPAEQPPLEQGPYERDFESHLMVATAARYADFRPRWLSRWRGSPGSYLMQVGRCLEDEVGRNRYLKPSSVKKLEITVQRELLLNAAESLVDLGSGPRATLLRIYQWCLMQSLLQQQPSALREMMKHLGKEHLGAIVLQTIFEFLIGCSEPGTPNL